MIIEILDERKQKGSRMKKEKEKEIMGKIIGGQGKDNEYKSKGRSRSEK